MKHRINRKKAAAVLVLSSLALLTGCGSAGNGAIPPVGGIGGGLGGITGGCIPVNAPLSFTGTSLMRDQALHIKGGVLPPDRYRVSEPGPLNIGTVVSGSGIVPQAIPQPYPQPYPQPGGYPPGYPTGYPQTYTTTISDVSPYNGSQITLNVQVIGGQYGYGEQVNVQGSLNLSYSSQTALSQLSMNNGFPLPSIYPGYPSPSNLYPAQTIGQPCISGIALYLTQAPGMYSNQLAGGSVYVYMSGLNSMNTLNGAGAYRAMAIDF